MTASQDFEADAPISAFLRWSIGNAASGNKRVDELVLQYGRRFEPTARPRGMILRPPKKSFNNSYYAASKFDYLYVEGFALVEATGVPFHHAWISDDGVRAFDVTLRRPLAGLHYFGIPFPLSVATCEMVICNPTLPLLDYSKSKEHMEKLIEEAAQRVDSGPHGRRSSV